MARIPMITRTFYITKVKVMCFDMSMNDVVNKDFTLAGRFAFEEKLLREIEKLNLVPDNCKLLKVLECSECEQLYGMEVSEFIKHAKMISPDTKQDNEETRKIKLR